MDSFGRSSKGSMRYVVHGSVVVDVVCVLFVSINDKLSDGVNFGGLDIQSLIQLTIAF